MNPVFSFSTDFSGSVSCEMLNFDEWLSSSSPASECQDCHFLRRETLRLKEKLKILEKKERHLKVKLLSVKPKLYLYYNIILGSLYNSSALKRQTEMSGSRVFPTV